MAEGRILTFIEAVTVDTEMPGAFFLTRMVGVAQGLLLGAVESPAQLLPV